jgi:hypothetical protein
MVTLNEMTNYEGGDNRGLMSSFGDKVVALQIPKKN